MNLENSGTESDFGLSIGAKAYFDRIVKEIQAGGNLQDAVAAIKAEPGFDDEIKEQQLLDAIEVFTRHWPNP